LATYQESYELDRYSQIAFLVEDRIFTMRSHRPSLDISFLYPYSPLEIAAEDSLQSTSPIQSQVVETPPVPVKPIDQEAPIRILTKPQTGIFLQSGRFSVESNAERLSKSIRHLNIPAIYYEEQHQGKKTWVVIAGPFDNKSDSNQARDTLSKNEINSFVVQY
jgi:cell division protein FtsN